MNPPPPVAGRNDVVAEQLVVEVPTRQRLDLVETVAGLDGRLALGKDLQVEVGELRLGIAEADRPVVIRLRRRSSRCRDRRPDVVATLGVVVVVATLAD